MIAVIVFVAYGVRRRAGTHWKRFGPLYLTCIAAPLILADLFRHLLQDQGIWKECQRPDGYVWGSRCTWSSSQYHCTLAAPHGCIPLKHENMAHLSMIGWIFTIAFTYVGFILLFVGTMWNANVLAKCRDVKKRWRELRHQM